MSIASTEKSLWPRTFPWLVPGNKTDFLPQSFLKKTLHQCLEWDFSLPGQEHFVLTEVKLPNTQPLRKNRCMLKVRKMSQGLSRELNDKPIQWTRLCGEQPLRQPVGCALVVLWHLISVDRCVFERVSSPAWHPWSPAAKRLTAFGGPSSLKAAFDRSSLKASFQSAVAWQDKMLLLQSWGGGEA